MKRILVITLLVLSCTMAFAQKEKEVKRPDSYNYTRGIEECSNGNFAEALTYFNQELESNPQNGYAYCWMAFVYLYQEEYGQALMNIDRAIRYVPKKDPVFLALSYRNRAEVYLALGDTIKALADYGTSIKIAPNETKGYEKRADLYYNLKQYDLSDDDYRRMIMLVPGGAMGYMGLGRNYNAQEKWQEAIEQFSYVISLYSDYSSGYAFRAESYIGLEDWAKATDDIIKALSIDAEDKAFYLMLTLDEAAFDMMIVKLKVQADKNPNETNWPRCTGIMYEDKKQYEKAIAFYEEANARDVSDVIISRISYCYNELGDFEQALKYIDKAIELDPEYSSYKIRKAYILKNLEHIDEAIALVDSCLQEEPDNSWLYAVRGEMKHYIGDLDGAIEDYTTNIILDDKHKYSYIDRGFIYTQLGRTNLAEADYKKVIEMEDSPEKYEHAMFAYHGLGDDDKAIAVMDTIISRSDNLPGDYYQAACLYSRMENKEKALEYLEKAFEEGYNRFNHIRMDYDMDFLRDTEEFNSLCNKYETLHKATLTRDDNDVTVGEEVVTEVPFTQSNGGLCHVECKINDLPLYFIFDTGASTISISKVEADFMLKNGYLSEKDVIGNQFFTDANGNINPGTIINLRQVEFGGLVLENVQASVVPNQKAPLLLGQTVFSRLGKIEIDNNNHILKITHTK